MYRNILVFWLTVTQYYWITELYLSTNEEKKTSRETLTNALGEHLRDSFCVCHLSCLIDTRLSSHYYTVQPFHFTPHD